MAVDKPELLDVLRDLASGQKQLADALRSKPSGKDPWDKFAALSTFLSSVLVAGAAVWFTHAYDRQQLNVNELTILEKFIPHLASGKPNEQQVAIIELSALGDTKVAVQLAKLYPNAGTYAGVQSIATHGDADQQALAKDALKTLRAPEQLAQLNVSTTWIQRAVNYVAHDQSAQLKLIKIGPSRLIGYGLDVSQLPDGGLAALKAAGVAHPAAVLAGNESITIEQADALLEAFFVESIPIARKTLQPQSFDSLSPARRYVVIDFMYNDGFGLFKGKLAPAIKSAMNARDPAEANRLWSAAAAIIERYSIASTWTRRNAKMMRLGTWLDVPDPAIVPLYRAGAN